MSRIMSINDHKEICSCSLRSSEADVEKHAANVSLCDALLKLGVPVNVEGIVDEETYQNCQKWNKEDLDKGLRPLFDMKLFKPYLFVTPSYEVADGVRLHSSGTGWKYVGLFRLWQQSEWALRFSLFRDVPYADGQRVVRLFCEQENDEKYRQVLSVNTLERDVPFFNKYTKIVKHGLPLEEIAGFFRENGSSTAVVQEIVELVGRERRYLPEGETVCF